MTRPGFSICTCPDAQLSKNYIENALVSHPAPEGVWERHVYWGDEGLPPAFWENLTLQGLFATPKALLVRNAHALPLDIWKKLNASLGKNNPLAWPFFCMEVNFERGKPKISKHVSKLACWKFAEKQGWIWTSSGLDERGIRQFVQQWATSHNLTIRGPVLQTLANAMPTDASAIASEMEKLLLAAGDSHEVTAEHLSLISYEAEMDIFAFISALQRGANQEKVWAKILGSGTGGDAMIFPFIGMLLREARILWQLLAGEPVRLPPSILGAKKQLAHSLGYPKLAKIWDVALEADKSIKTGECSPDQAMEMLAAKLFTIFGIQNHRKNTFYR